MVFFRIPISNPNYYEYNYILHRACDPNSVVLFVSHTMSPPAFSNILKAFQSRRMYMSFAQGYGKYFILSFYLRIFDLIGENVPSQTTAAFLQ